MGRRAGAAPRAGFQAIALFAASGASLIADNSGGGEPRNCQPLALTRAGLSGRDDRRTARARFIPVLVGGGACPVSGLDHGFTGLCERLVQTEAAGQRRGSLFSGRLCGRNLT